jgi:hypothetical protein
MPSRLCHACHDYLSAKLPQVFLARWRETTVAVKVLGAMGAGAAPGLDEEFPDAAAAKGHPLYESLQKEAALMASLRHPSIVMYLGVCLDPPAVVTEWCARGEQGGRGEAGAGGVGGLHCVGLGFVMLARMLALSTGLCQPKLQRQPEFAAV